MSYKLEQPYTEQQKADFIVYHNHQSGRAIEEASNGDLYALDANEMMGTAGKPVINPNYEEEQAALEAERIAMLNLTAADVERAIYKAKGIDFEDIVKIVEELNSGTVEQELTNFSTVQPLNSSTAIDTKALKIELKANNFYRGNPYIDAVGTILGFTKQQLDEFFETNDYTKLVSNEGDKA